MTQISSDALQGTFEELHRLSQRWHIFHEDLTTLEETLDFVLNVHKKYVTVSDNDNAISTRESILFLSSQIHIRKRWAANYNTRTKIRIDLFFNLASQGDNRTNLKIANTSKIIAEATLKDSSSMITIAAVTMIFLPGTFVSVSISRYLPFYPVRCPVSTPP